MKKLLTLLSTAALACTLAIPVFARPKSPKAAKAQGSTASTAVHNQKSKTHRKHVSKRGAKKGAKTGQQATSPTTTK